MSNSIIPLNLLSKLGVFAVSGALIGASFIGGTTQAAFADSSTPVLDANGEYHPVQDEGACKGLTGVAQPNGIDARADIDIDQSAEVSQSGLDYLIKVRQDALNEGILWGGKPMREYLKSNNISEDTYLHPKWRKWAEIFSIQRALEASVNGRHLRMTGSDEAGKPGGIGQESLADNSSNTAHGDIVTGMKILEGEKGRYLDKTVRGKTDVGETGHYESLISPGITGYGIGQVHNTTILTGAFDNSSNSEDYLGWKGKCEFKLVLKNSVISDNQDEINWDEDGNRFFVRRPVLHGRLLEVNKPMTLDLTSQTTKIQHPAYLYTFPVRLYGKFVSLTPDILKTDGMTVTGLKPGKGKVRFESGGEQLSGEYELEVVGAKLVSIDIEKDYETVGLTPPLLPERVVAHYSDGSIRYIPVYWDENTAYKERENWGKTYQVTGHIPGADDVTVNVKIRPSSSFPANPITITTKVGEAPKLPTSAVVWSESHKGQFRWSPTRWNGTIDPALYATPGNVFQVYGEVDNWYDGGATPVLVTVKVEGNPPVEPPKDYTPKPGTETPQKETPVQPDPAEVPVNDPVVPPVQPPVEQPKQPPVTQPDTPVTQPTEPQAPPVVPSVTPVIPPATPAVIPVAPSARPLAPVEFPVAPPVPPVAPEQLKQVAANPPVLRADKESYAQGDKVNYELSGFTPQAEIVVTLHSTPLEVGRVQADNAGVARGSFTIPAGFETGKHTLIGVEASGKQAQDEILVVADKAADAKPGTPNTTVAPVAETAEPALANTGSEFSGYALLGVFGAMVGAVLAVRKRANKNER